MKRKVVQNDLMVYVIAYLMKTRYFIRITYAGKVWKALWRRRGGFGGGGGGGGGGGVV